MTEWIHIEPYSPAWPVWYEREAAVVAKAMGALCLRVHHVGSTAIPGLAAKPIIDMAVECPIYPPDVVVSELLARIEYVHVGELGVVGRHFYHKGEPRAFHLHLVPEHGEVLRRQLAFRDFLRSHPDAAQEYQRIKEMAAPGQPLGSTEYLLAKGPFVAEVLAKALSDMP